MEDLGLGGWVFVSTISVALFIFFIYLVDHVFNIAKEYERAVIFRLGRLKTMRGPGFFLLAPIIESMVSVDLRTVSVPIASQRTITKDSVSITADAILWYRVTDVDKAVTAIDDYESAVTNIALTSLRNVLGQHVLDEILSDRDRINTALREIVDEVTEKWGVMIERVEIKDISLPDEIMRAIAMEAEAMREKRARIIKAEAELEASQKLVESANTLMSSPASMELRRMQMITEVGAEQNTTTIVMVPSEFITLARDVINKGK